MTTVIDGTTPLVQGHFGESRPGRYSLANGPRWFVDVVQRRVIDGARYCSVLKVLVCSPADPAELFEFGDLVELVDVEQLTTTVGNRSHRWLRAAWIRAAREATAV